MECLQNVYFLHFFDISCRLRVVRSKRTKVLQLRINWEIIFYLPKFKKIKYDLNLIPTIPQYGDQLNNLFTKINDYIY